MLTYIILAIVSVIVGIWIVNKLNKPEAPTTPVETKEEEPIGYESGSFASTLIEEQPVVVVEEAPKKKRAPKTAKTSAKPKKTKKVDA